MRKPILLCGFLLLCASICCSWPRSARAEGGDFGLGLILGSPTGLSLKFYLGQDTAIDGAVGAAFAGGSGIHAHADLLWHPWVLAREDVFDLGVYLGLGGRILSHNQRDRGDDYHLGARGPVGLVFDFSKGEIPLDAFVEIALVVDFVAAAVQDESTIEITANAGLGARYYF